MFRFLVQLLQRIDLERRNKHAGEARAARHDAETATTA
jgi:hypothetical protein